MTQSIDVARAPGGGQGFTLMELLVTVAIISIVVAIAYPNYIRQTERARRTDATTALLNVAAAEEKFFLQNNAYTTDLGDDGLKIKSTSENGYYSLSVALPAGGGFVATAAAVPDAGQHNDKQCKTFTIDHTGAKSAKDSAGAASDVCW